MKKRIRKKRRDGHTQRYWINRGADFFGGEPIPEEKTLFSDLPPGAEVTIKVPGGQEPLVKIEPELPQESILKETFGKGILLPSFKRNKKKK